MSSSTHMRGWADQSDAAVFQTRSFLHIGMLTLLAGASDMLGRFARLRPPLFDIIHASLERPALLLLGKVGLRAVGVARVP
jgi:hypothetical protein